MHQTGCHGLASSDLQDGGVPSEHSKVAALIGYNAYKKLVLNVYMKPIYLRFTLKGCQHKNKIGMDRFQDYNRGQFYTKIFKFGYFKNWEKINNKIIKFEVQNFDHLRYTVKFEPKIYEQL